MKSLLNSVFQTIRDGRILVPGDRAGVAVSGGADSVALLGILERLRDRLGITLLVVHFNHQLRGAESDGDAEFVKNLARARGLECVIGREDVAAAATAHKWNLEDAARRLRYAFFERVVAEGRATRIVVAHTADDQAETVLAHILRGTGPSGLAGIYPAIGSIARPLLPERREVLRKYLRGQGQIWREDSTNLDVTKQRARIRKQLLPLIEHDFSPRVVDHLAQLAGLAREEQTFWNALVEDRFRALVRADEGRFGIRIEDLLAPMHLSSASQPTALRTLTQRLIRRVSKELRRSAELTAVHVDQVIQLASSSVSGKRVQLPGGIQVERNFGELIFSRARHAKSSTRLQGNLSQGEAYLYVVSLPSHGIATVTVPELKSRFRLKVIDWSVSERDTKRDSAALDASLLREPLILRNWRPGDAYRPRGRGHTKKLKEMFLDGRVPSRERGCWPVLESDGRVAWARGMPPADEFCARESTRAGIVIEEIHL